jgi:hypothetical protein
LKLRRRHFVIASAVRAHPRGAFGSIRRRQSPLPPTTFRDATILPAHVNNLCVMSKNDDHDALMRGWIDNRLLDQIQDYIARGRRLTGIDYATLRRQWIAAMKLWSTKSANAEDHKLREDIQAELQLRGYQLPYDSVKDELARLTAMSEVFIESLKPEDRARMSRRIGTQIETFHASVKKSLKN